MPVQDYSRPQAVTEEWPDHLARRMMSPTKRLNTLSLSHDGRIALGLSSTVTVLNPALVFRVVKALASVEQSTDHKPMEYALLDSEARVSRGIRPPVVGHEVAFEPEYRKPKDVRKDTTLGRGDIAHLSWTSSSTGSVMFVVNGEGLCFVAVPRYANATDGSDGTWGGLLGSWRYKRVFPEVSASRKAPVSGDDDNIWSDVVDSRAVGSSKKDKEHAGPSETSEIAKRKVKGKLGHPRKHARSNVLGSLADGSGDRFPQNQVRCVSFTRVFKNSQAATNGESSVSNYIVLGRKDGTFLFSFKGWRGAEDIQEPILSLHSGWNASVSCLEDVEYSGRSLTLIAVGGAFGELILYGIWFEEFSDELFMLTSEALWQADSSVLFGAVTSLSWSCCAYEGHVRLAVGCGNSITVVHWSNILSSSSGADGWATPDVHRIPDAHESFVSSLQLLMDGSVVSSSLDGKVCRWRLEKWEHGGETQQFVYCGLLQNGPSSEPVMALERTPFGFGVAVMTTATQTYTEVNEPNDDAKSKYGAGSRRSVLSLYVQPASQGIPEVISRIITSVDFRAWTRRYVGEAIVMWDIELLLEQLEGEDENKVLDALRQKFYDMLKRLKEKDIPNLSEENFHHYSRVALCLSQLILRTGGTDIAAIEAMEESRADISNSVRCIHYNACLASFLGGDFPVDNLSLDEFRALESMCQFASICKQELFWDAPTALERVRLVREAFSPRIAAGESTAMPCAICAPESTVPLVSDTEDAGFFYCASNDCFARCVLSGLPCSDVVPLICYACEARAVTRDFDPYKERGEEFAWIEDISRCPMCLCPLLPSSVEIQ